VKSVAGAAGRAVLVSALGVGGLHRWIGICLAGSNAHDESMTRGPCPSFSLVMDENHYWADGQGRVRPETIGPTNIR
jgi:hypothetical protein